MKPRKVVTTKKNTRYQTTPPRRESGEYMRYALILTVAFALLGGFALSARKHFAAIDYGFRNVRLKKEIEQLKNERRALLLERETVLSPAELEKNAQKIGLRRLSGEQLAAHSTNISK